MGIVNVTPDSFSDGGRHCRRAAARSPAASDWSSEGADILDIGGESTPARAPRRSSAEEELARVLPVLAARCRLGVPVSVDTSKPEVMRAALDLGADIVNDIARAARARRARGRGRAPDAAACA